MALRKGTSGYRYQRSESALSSNSRDSTLRLSECGLGHFSPLRADPLGRPEGANRRTLAFPPSLPVVGRAGIAGINEYRCLGPFLEPCRLAVRTGFRSDRPGGFHRPPAERLVGPNRNDFAAGGRVNPPRWPVTLDRRTDAADGEIDPGSEGGMPSQ